MDMIYLFTAVFLSFDPVEYGNLMLVSKALRSPVMGEPVLFLMTISPFGGSVFFMQAISNTGILPRIRVSLHKNFSGIPQDAIMRDLEGGRGYI